ncbi:Ig-like domain-containing protein [Pedobacter jeongneungensis]|uniref:Ig-like domain-containing protein n=1 Tax=Pedobacter jeongneungensis TaxID=947309 RepID=UPI0004686200|nr:Ig-like domain-containing protein [Pedobacter jeongneungensis]
MNKAILFATLLCASITQSIWAQQTVNLITTDVDHFWQAYDKINATKDTSAQYAYLNKLFLEQATPGQKAMIQARNYTPKDYLNAITQKQTYFNSIRSNTLKAKDYAAAIAKKIDRLKQLYPGLKPAEIYFTVGAFRSGGTTTGKMVLIGSEIAMASEHLDNLVFTNVHEYVHTQQKTNIGDNLLAQCVMEGVAEFVSEKVMAIPSTLPALTYGKAHTESIKQVFALQMFNTGNGFWLYSNAENQFGVRDLGYYVGYAIADQYYTKATDKVKAISDMIELDYNNTKALAAYVDQSGYFNRTVKQLNDEYEKNRPLVVSATPEKSADSGDTLNYKFKVIFSKPMDKRFRNFDFGPLGKDNAMFIKNFIGFSADGITAEFEVQLKPNRQYQLVLGESFRDLNGAGIKPYLIDFKTGEK